MQIDELVPSEWSVTSDKTSCSQSLERYITSISTVQVTAVKQVSDSSEDTSRPSDALSNFITSTQNAAQVINSDIAKFAEQLMIQKQESEERLHNLNFNISAKSITNKALKRYIIWQLIDLPEVAATQKMKVALKNSLKRLGNKPTTLARWHASNENENQLEMQRC